MVVQWLRLRTHCAGAWVRSLARGLDPVCHSQDRRSCVLLLRPGVAKQFFFLKDNLKQQNLGEGAQQIIMNCS